MQGRSRPEIRPGIIDVTCALRAAAWDLGRIERNICGYAKVLISPRAGTSTVFTRQRPGERHVPFRRLKFRMFGFPRFEFRATEDAKRRLRVRHGPLSAPIRTVRRGLLPLWDMPKILWSAGSRISNRSTERLRGHKWPTQQTPLLILPWTSFKRL